MIRYGEAETAWPPTLWRRAGERSRSQDRVGGALGLEHKLPHVTDRLFLLICNLICLIQ